MEKFEINHHDFTEVECPHCHIHYLLQGGGQKSGSSSAVHIEAGPKGKVIGYCSSRCLNESQGGRIEDTMAYRVMKDWGLNYDEIFPVGYLAPARVPRAEEPVMVSGVGY